MGDKVMEAISTEDTVIDIAFKAFALSDKEPFESWTPRTPFVGRLQGILWMVVAQPTAKGFVSLYTAHKAPPEVATRLGKQLNAQKDNQKAYFNTQLSNLWSAMEFELKQLNKRLLLVEKDVAELKEDSVAIKARLAELEAGQAAGVAAAQVPMPSPRPSPAPRVKRALGSGELGPGETEPYPIQIRVAMVGFGFGIQLKTDAYFYSVTPKMILAFVGEAERVQKHLENEGRGVPMRIGWGGGAFKDEDADVSIREIYERKEVYMSRMMTFVVFVGERGDDAAAASDDDDDDDNDGDAPPQGKAPLAADGGGSSGLKRSWDDDDSEADDEADVGGGDGYESGGAAQEVVATAGGGKAMKAGGGKAAIKKAAKTETSRGKEKAAKTETSRGKEKAVVRLEPSESSDLGEALVQEMLSRELSEDEITVVNQLVSVMGLEVEQVMEIVRVVGADQEKVVNCCFDANALSTFRQQRVQELLSEREAQRLGFGTRAGRA